MMLHFWSTKIRTLALLFDSLAALYQASDSAPQKTRRKHLTTGTSNTASLIWHVLRYQPLWWIVGPLRGEARQIH